MTYFFSLFLIFSYKIVYIMSGTLLDVMNQMKKTMGSQDKCNWKTTDSCIFKDYVRQGDKCLVPGESNPSYTGLETYSPEVLKTWLQALYNRNWGGNPNKGEAANVYDYWNRCKGVPGYEFLRDLNFKPVIAEEEIDNTALLVADQKLVNNYVDSRKSQFQDLQSLQLVRDELEKNVQLLQSRQDLYIESSRVNIEENVQKLAELDRMISVLRRQTMYDMEGDMNNNAKVFFLGNVLFYIIVFIIGVMVYRFMTK